MTTDPPLLYLCAAAQDTRFVESVRERLRPRGLDIVDGGELGAATPIDERQAAIDASALVLVVVSHASMRSSVVRADYQYALGRGRPTIPLIVESPRDLPADLSQVQGIDFSRSAADGWDGLLLALEALGLARAATSPRPVLDAEVVLARAISGRTPPTWLVSRTLTPGRQRQLSRMTVSGAALVIPLTILAFFATGNNPLIVLFGAYTLYILYSRFSPRLLRYEKRGVMVILTPEGIVVKTKTGAVSAAFAEATMSAAPSGEATIGQARGEDGGGEGVMLSLSPGPGRKHVAMPLDKLLGRDGSLYTQGLALYTAYRARYGDGSGDGRPQPAEMLPAPPAPVAPLIFLSYSRKDADLVDRLEMNLRRSGYNPWVDRSGLLGGQEWSAELRAALDLCAALVVVVSPAAMRSAAVAREYTYALGAGKPVLGALARTTRRIPPALAPRMHGDLRQALLYGTLDLALALDEMGIRPLTAGTDMPLNSTVVAARVTHGQTLPDTQVFRGRLLGQWALAAAVLPLTALVLFGLYLLEGPVSQSGSVYFLFLLAILLLGPGLAVAAYIRRRLRHPDYIILRLDGYIIYTGAPRLIENPYEPLSAVRIGRRVGRHGLFKGVPIVNTTGAGKDYTQEIGHNFPDRRRIAAQIVADCARYQQQRRPPASAR